MGKGPFQARGVDRAGQVLHEQPTFLKTEPPLAEFAANRQELPEMPLRGQGIFSLSSMKKGLHVRHAFFQFKRVWLQYPGHV